MKFGKFHKAYFDADEDAFSVVTADERRNSQITITDAEGESDVVLNAIREDQIPRLATKGRTTSFRIWRADASTSSASLKMNFPKAKGNELRVYRNARKGFAYETGDMWFVFRRRKRLFVGSMPEKAWCELGRADDTDAAYVEDATDTLGGIQPSKRIASLRHHRSPKLAATCLKAAGFKCEVDKRHTVFPSRVTGNGYLEPHHLIPVSLQDTAGFPGRKLDAGDNVFGLCPDCHARIHHGECLEVEVLVKKLLKRRSTVLARLDLKMSDVLQCYGC